MNIQVKTIPNDKQRYDTLGDYDEISDGNYWINISEGKESTAIMVHELVELLLVVKRKIKMKDINEWDFNFKGDGEPGEAKGCPYKKEHLFANKIEALFLKEFKKYGNKS